MNIRTAKAALLVAVAVAVAVALVGGVACKKDEPSRWDKAAEVAKSAAPIAPASAPAQEGAAFNTLFPADGEGGYKRIFTQEKEGYAEAKLQKDGKDVAKLTISDTRTNEDAKKKFAGATEKVAGHPVVAFGKKQTAMLVSERYQVKVDSDVLDHEARKSWLSRFDLAKLAKL